VIDAVARPPLLTTEHLLLRELTVDDAPAVSRRAGDKKVARYLLAVPSPYPVSLAARWITGRISWWPQGRGITLAITRRDDPDELLGSVSLRRFSRDRRAELGYWLGADAWGHGYATEAAGALVDFGFAEMGLARIYAHVLAGNAASCRVLDKLGMVHEGIRRRHVRKGKTLHDIVLYGMLREEWRER
jgi:RimJ/RimL family protein N-acetyltransferase